MVHAAEVMHGRLDGFSGCRGVRYIDGCAEDLDLGEVLSQSIDGGLRRSNRGLQVPDVDSACPVFEDGTSG